MFVEQDFSLPFHCHVRTVHQLLKIIQGEAPTFPVRDSRQFRPYAIDLRLLRAGRDREPEIGPLADASKARKPADQ
jgi:hypothetical protein